MIIASELPRCLREVVPEVEISQRANPGSTQLDQKPKPEGHPQIETLVSCLAHPEAARYVQMPMLAITAIGASQLS